MTKQSIFINDNLTSSEPIDGGFAYEYIAATIRVDTTGDYLVSIPGSQVDVLYYFYQGGFDPTDFATNFYVGNDDFAESYTALTGDLATVFRDRAVCNGGSGIGPRHCPASFVRLEANQCYTLVVSTYDGNASLGASVTFAVDGPGTADIVAGNCSTSSAGITVESAGQIVEAEVARVLQTSIAANQRMVRDARERFMVATAQMAQAAEAGVTVSQDVPLAVTGGLNAGPEVGSGAGTFYGQWGDHTGRNRTFLTGDFSVQWDDLDYRSNALAARLGREWIVSDMTMLGAFLAFDAMQSKRTGAINGSLDSITYALGGYAVSQLDRDVFLDAWGSIGRTEGNVKLHDDSSEVAGDYSGEVFTVGASLVGTVDMGTYDLWPTLEIAYGNAKISDYALFGSDTLSIQGTKVVMWRIAATPEIRWTMTDAPFGGRYVFAPSVICEGTEGSSSKCGGGVRFGIRSSEESAGRSTILESYLTRVSSASTAGVRLGYEQRW